MTFMLATQEGYQEGECRCESDSNECPNPAHDGLAGGISKAGCRRRKALGEDSASEHRRELQGGRRRRAPAPPPPDPDRFECAVSKGKLFTLPTASGDGTCTCVESCPAGQESVTCTRRRDRRRDVLGRMHEQRNETVLTTLRNGSCCGTVTSHVWWDDDR